jgi:hypothetical protein
MISATGMDNEYPLLDENILASRVARKRSSCSTSGDLERAMPNVPVTKRRKTKRVSWADKNHIQIQPDYRKLFNDYKDEDVWYTVSSDFFANFGSHPRRVLLIAWKQ